MSLIKNLRAVIRIERVETDRVERRLARAASVDDLRALARRRLPRGVFGYVDGGADDELTMAANRAAFARTGFRPRVLRNVDAAQTSSALLGSPVSYPLVLAPTGFTRIVHPDGELAVARAAAPAGLPYTLSTLSTASIEDVRAVSDGRLWFQVYAWRDRGLVKEMISRAASAEYDALVRTVDTPVLGRRERDVRRGFALPPSIDLRTFVDGALHPSWTLSFLRSDPIRFANVLGRDVGDASSPVKISDYIHTQFDPDLSWSDVEWLRSVWDGGLVIKGIQTVEDAALQTPGWTPWRCRTTAAGSSMARPRPSRSCPASRTPSGTGPPSSATAASVAAATSSRRWRPVPRPAWRGAPTSTPWLPVVNGASTASCPGSVRTWSAR